MSDAAPSPPPSPLRPGRTDWRRASGGGGGAHSADGRGARRAGVMIALFGFLGGLVALWYWIQTPTPPRLLTVPVSEYSDPAWPANPWAERDSDLLTAMFPVPETKKLFNFQERDRLVPTLQEAEGRKDQALVVHLTALAVTHDGAVHLVPGNGKRGTSGTWLPLADILAAVTKNPATSKMLLLDIARPVADTFRGPLEDDVAATLDAQLRKTPPAFPVLVSCSPGEVSLPMTGERASAFAWYAAQGLAGAADRYNPKAESDNRVSVRELATFIAARVHRWARSTRGTAQTPHLHGPPTDFTLTFKEIEAPAPAESPAPYPAVLLDGWKVRDAARSAGEHRVAPAAAARLDALLLRAEHDADAGLADRVSQWLPNEVAALRPALSVKRPGPVPVPPLATLRAGRPAPAAELRNAVEKYLAIALAASPTPAVEMEKAQAEFLEKAKGNAVDVTGLLWDRLLADPEPSARKVRAISAAVQGISPPETEELIALRRVADYSPRTINWPAAACHLYLKAADSAGRAMAQLPDGFFWAKALLEDADGQLAGGEIFVFSDRSTAEVRNAIHPLEEAERKYTAAARLMEATRDARAALVDGALVLAGSVDVAPGDSAWLAAADAVAALADQVIRPSNRAPDSTALRDAMGRAVHALKPLRDRYATATVLARIAAVKNGGPGELRALEGLLASAALAADDRKKVWDAAHQLGAALNKSVAKLDEGDDEARRTTAAPPPPERGGAPGPSAASRSAVAAALLRVIGLSPGDAAPADVWLERRSARHRELVAREDWPAAHRLGLGPAVPGGLLAVDAVAPPAARARQAEDSACRTWLAEHFRDAKLARGSVRGAARFYDEAIADSKR